MRPDLRDDGGMTLDVTAFRLAAAWLRRKVRGSEALLILLAVVIGGAAGLLSVVQGAIARTIQHLLFALPSGQRLSATPAIPLPALLALPVGGVILALFSHAAKARARKMVDAVEANALHGGRMSWSDSLVISGQTIISNGFGASVGLEAAYAQAWRRTFGARLHVGRAVQRLFGGPVLSELVVGGLRHWPAAVRALMRQTHGQAF